MVLLVSFFLPFSSSKAEAEIEEVFIVDDGWVEVPLDFTFPFYGNSYVTSFMFSNGVVGFLDPLDVAGTGIVYDGLCCDGQDLSSFTGVRFNYTIMPWNTDLIDIGVGRFYTQGDSTFQKYMWEDLSEYYLPNTRNTFDLTIYPMGNIAVNYEELQINNHAITVGVVGDLSAGEYEQWFYNHPTSGAVFWNSQEDDPVEIAGGESICSVVPDSHISCLYYPQVYADNVYNQQCSINPLYDYGCDGWDDAYIDEYIEPEEPTIFIEYDLGAIEIDLDIPIIEAYVIELPEFEMEEFTQETMMAEIEAEMEEYFDLLPEIEPEPVEEPMEETVEEELDEPEPEENSIQEEQTEEEQEQEEIIEEESEEEEAEEVEEEAEEEREEPEPEPEVEVVEEPKLAEKKKKDSKRDKMREIISKKLQSLATEMGEAASLEEQQKLQSLILALLNFNAGFNTYQGSLVDGTFYEEKDIYLNNKIPENQNGLRNGLANEILHNKLVDLQWQK
jgi:hypothetical protein